jgi:hypothetical protein
MSLDEFTIPPLLMISGGALLEDAASSATLFASSVFASIPAAVLSNSPILANSSRSERSEDRSELLLLLLPVANGIYLVRTIVMDEKPHLVWLIVIDNPNF